MSNLGDFGRAASSVPTHSAGAHAAGETQSVIAVTTGLSLAVVGRVLRGEIASFETKPKPAP